MPPSYPLSKWLIQACPPDLSESRIEARWTFGLYEILDHRLTPMDPAVLHAMYRGSVELAQSELPDTKDPLFAGRLEEVVVKKWKKGW